MNAKIIQIATLPETEETYGFIVALTENGHVFRRRFPATQETAIWDEIETPGLVHRAGKLIGD